MWGATPGAETHRFVPATFYNTFSFAHPPALRIKPGDTVVTVTADAFGMDANDRRVASAPNPQTGPFYVDGAEPGDMLVLTVNRIEPNRGTARSSTLLAPYAVDPAFLRSTAERQARQETWVIDKAKGVAHNIHGSAPRRVGVSAHPDARVHWHSATIANVVIRTLRSLSSLRKAHLRAR
jgi:acetamidase/formamidase